MAEAYLTKHCDFRFWAGSGNSLASQRLLTGTFLCVESRHRCALQRNGNFRPDVATRRLLVGEAHLISESPPRTWYGTNNALCWSFRADSVSCLQG
jgi:hypothetical protein